MADYEPDEIRNQIISDVKTDLSHLVSNLIEGASILKHSIRPTYLSATFPFAAPTRIRQLINYRHNDDPRETFEMKEAGVYLGGVIAFLSSVTVLGYISQNQEYWPVLLIPGATNTRSLYIELKIRARSRLDDF